MFEKEGIAEMDEQEKRPERTEQSTGTAYGKPAKTEQKENLCSAGRWALLAAFLVGTLYSKMTVGSVNGNVKGFFTGYYRNIFGKRLYIWPAAGIFTVLFAAAVLLFCRFYSTAGNAMPEERQHPLRKPAFRIESRVWLAVMLAAAANLTLGLQGAVDGFLVTVIWHGAAVLWVASRTGQLTDCSVGAYVIPDLLRCVGKGFTGLLHWPVNGIRLMAERPRKKADGQRIFTSLWFTAAAVLLLIALALLGAADDSFAQVLESLQFWQNSSFDFTQPVVNILFGTVFGAFFYGLTISGTVDVAAAPRPGLKQRYQQAEKLHRVPSGPIISMLALFSAVYLLFIGLQFRYLFGALAGQLPQGFTVAGYARQGFFQLCWVMLCNFMLLFLVWLVAKDNLQTKGLRIGTVVLLALSLVLWLTAALKLGLYIGLYGFTPKRLKAVWALLVLATAAGITARSVFKPCRVVRPVLLTAGVLLLPLLLWV